MQNFTNSSLNSTITSSVRPFFRPYVREQISQTPKSPLAQCGDFLTPVTVETPVMHAFWDAKNPPVTLLLTSSEDYAFSKIQCAPKIATKKFLRGVARVLRVEDRVKKVFARRRTRFARRRSRQKSFCEASHAFCAPKIASKKLF